ncbi:MAG: sulfotransferase family protein [Actinomycetota bacterium]
MTLRIVGAGLGRTGTHSLKSALETLLGGPCYHMLEVFGHPEHIPLWRDAATGDLPDWDRLFDGYVAAVDWPVASFWREVSAAYPDAIILLSTRSDGETWWRSASQTIFAVTEQVGDAPFRDMWDSIASNKFTPQFREREPAIEAYQRHNDEVRREAPADRLVEWQPGDGWEPLAEALGVPVPDEPFPHTNTTEDFRKMAGMDA